MATAFEQYDEQNTGPSRRKFNTDMTIADRFIVHKRIKGGQVHYVQGDRVIASFGMTLRTSYNAGESWCNLATLPVCNLSKIGCRFGLYRRLFRDGVHAVIPSGDSDESWLVLAHRHIYRVDASGDKVASLWAIQKGSRPLRNGLSMVGKYLYVGDYFGNSDREPVRIYRIEIATGKWECFYEFPAGQVRHIHLIQYDARIDRLWVGTGDEDSECLLGTLCPKTAQMSWVGGGSQDWRAVSLAFTNNSVYWGTDNHTGGNHIWKLGRDQTQPVLLNDVVGPVYYHSILDNGILFATTVEKGEGDQDRYGRLYLVDMQDHVILIGCRRKDMWSSKYFGYGVMEFAEGYMDGRKFWLTFKGYRGGLRSELIELVK